MKKLFALILSALMLSSCGAKPVATVGDIKITKNEFEFFLDQIKTQMKDTELQTDEDWQTVEIEGKKAIEVAKDMAMEIAVQTALYIEAPKSEGIELTDAEKQEVLNTKENFISGHGGEKEYKAFLKEAEISDSFIDMMCNSTVYRTKVYGMIMQTAAPGEEALKEYFDENKAELETDFRKAKHILIATIDTKTNLPKSDEEQQEAKALADDIFEKVKAGADFDALMNRYSEDPGLAQSPGGYLFGTGDMVAEFEQATDSIGFGDVTMCKSAFGYHIIKRLPIVYDDVRLNIADRIIGDMVDAQVEEWKNKNSVTVTENEDILKEIK